MQLVKNFREDKFYREEYFGFIRKIFPSISFNEWHAKGFWTENYIPFSLIDSGKMVANTSAAKMEVLINGQKFKGIQIGAVGTLHEYRNKGLSRKLMNEVIDFYQEETDLFFLFANDSVKDFYPKFGFEHKLENTFIRYVNFNNSKFSARKLKLNHREDYDLLINLLGKRKPLTKIFGAVNYQFITMWHILNLYSNNLYYLEDAEAVIIKTENENSINLIDLIFRENFDLDSAIPKIIETGKIHSIKFCFPPDQLKFSFDEVEPEDSLLFVKGKLDLGGSMFRFPMTAQT